MVCMQSEVIAIGGLSSLIHVFSLQSLPCPDKIFVVVFVIPVFLLIYLDEIILSASKIIYSKEILILH